MRTALYVLPICALLGASDISAAAPAPLREIKIISSAGARALVDACSAPICALLGASDISAAAPAPLREIKIISSAGARALVDACSAWAEKNKRTVAIAVLDWGGNLVESHAMEGAPGNSIDTALLKAKSALRWRRPTSETAARVKSGENLAPTYIVGDFPQPGGVPIVVNGEVVGAMGVSSADGEKCAAAGIEAVFGNAGSVKGG